MAHGHLGVEGRQGRGKGRGGVALHQHQIRLVLFKLRLQPLQSTAGDVGERLLGGH